MDRATDILKNEHRIIERMLVVFERELNLLEQGGSVTLDVFKKTLHFFRTFADGCHHRKEEMVLFPKLVEHGFAWDAGPVEVMLLEHDIGRNELGKCAEGVRLSASGDPTGTDLLLKHGRRFITLLRDHIQKEDTILFAMADQQFDEKEQAALIAAFSSLEHDLISCQASRDLIGMLEQLENQSTNGA